MVDIEKGLKGYCYAEHDLDDNRETLANWYKDNGQPERAEFIKIQLMLATLDMGDARRKNLKIKEQELLEQHGMNWMAADFDELDPYIRADPKLYGNLTGGWPKVDGYFMKPKFHRGLVEEIKLPFDCASVNLDVGRLKGIRRLDVRGGTTLQPMEQVNVTVYRPNLFTKEQNDDAFLNDLEMVTLENAGFATEMLARQKAFNNLKVVSAVQGWKKDIVEEFSELMPEVYIAFDRDLNPKDAVALIDAHNAGVVRKYPENKDFHERAVAEKEEDKEIAHAREMERARERDAARLDAVAGEAARTLGDAPKNTSKPGWWATNVLGDNALGRAADKVAGLGWRALGYRDEDGKNPPGGSGGRG